MSTSYGYEKISSAVEALAVGTGTIQERLMSAFMAMSAVSDRDFDGQELEDWRSIFARATAKEGSDGSFRATLLTMDTHDAVRLAQDIVNLEAMLATD